MLQIVLAYLLDLVVGDPPRVPHPVVIMGRLIALLEALLRRLARRPPSLRVAGVFLAATVVGISYAAALLLLKLAALLHPWVARALEVWLVSTTFAVRGLAEAARGVEEPLREGRLVLARQRVAMIVGRDTASLDEEGVARATVETVAENIVDGFISPLFYALLGGAPLAIAYRAVNTLDSMVGYRDEEYRDLGWASARLDDLANFLPARLAGLLLVAAAWLAGRRADAAWRALKSDARKHPSPNSGYPEAAMAGALGLRLGGLNYYHGRPSFRPYLNEGGTSPSARHIAQAVDMLYLTSALAVASGLATLALAGKFF